jgi:lysophospholipase L1-like esterase
MWAPSALARFDRDVLSTPGVRYVILAAGVNDIGRNDETGLGLTADDLIAGYRQAIQRARSMGVLIYGATMTPFRDSSYDPPDAPRSDRELLRQTVNS